MTRLQIFIGKTTKQKVRRNLTNVARRVVKTYQWLKLFHTLFLRINKNKKILFWLDIHFNIFDAAGVSKYLKANLLKELTMSTQRVKIDFKYPIMCRVNKQEFAVSMIE